MAVTLAELFPTLRSSRASARLRAAAPRASAITFETIEPRVLLSADFTAQAADGLAAGLDQFDVRIDNFLLGDDLFDTRVPMLLEVKMDESGGLVNEAPTIGELFSVPVDANLDGATDVGHGTLSDTWDDDEWKLLEIDTYKYGQIGSGNNDGYVTAPEFLEKWLWDPISNYLRSVGDGWLTQDFVDFLTGGGTYDGLDQQLDILYKNANTLGTLPLYEIEFNILGVTDTTQDPDAEYTFLIDFELVITRNFVPLDLGLQADALRLLYFTGEFDDTADPVKVPTVRTTSTLSFGFEFGIHTGGEAVVDENDFFVRSADPLVLGVEAEDSDVDFHLNVGFLGGEVENGTFSLQADVETMLLDPDDPAVLGFTTAQRGVEQANGVVTAVNPLPAETDPASPNYDLAHDTSFFLRVGNIGINTPVTIPDDGGNGSLDDLRSDIEAALVAAGLGDVINVSFAGPGADTLRFSLIATTDTPLGFANETYGTSGSTPTFVISSLPAALEYANDQRFLLSLGGAIPRLVTVAFPDPAKEDIKFADATNAVLADEIRAPNAPAAFDITADAVFTVDVTRANGARDSYGFTLTPTDTDGNTTALELAADLDAMLNGTALDALVQFYLDGSGHLRLHAIDGSVTGIQLSASGTATSEIGFADYAQVTLELSATAPAVANLGDAAHFRLYYTGTSFGGTVDVTVPDNNSADVAALASDINAAIDTAVGSNLFDVEVTATGRIVLVANTTDVVAFRVVTVNESIDDLVADVNRALERAGFGTLVTASTPDGVNLQLQSTGAATGKTLEISHTLTFDAGVTFAELAAADIEDLFGAAEGTDSHVEFNFPVRVLPGLDDGSTPADDNWNPQYVAMVGNFSPFARGADGDGYDVATYDDIEHRFLLNFKIEPDATVPEQDSPRDYAPAIVDLDGEIVLNNFGELLNFNLVGAESMVGLIASLGSSLQQLANSATFAGFEIPFTGAQLSDLLNFVDPDKLSYSGLFDTWLIDTNGDGIEGISSGAAPDYPGLVKRAVVGNTTLLVPAFTTAQALAWRLHEMFEVPLSSINATYDPDTNKLTYDIDRVAGNRTVVTDTQQPFEFDVEMDPFGKLTLDASADLARKQVTLSGRPGVQMTMGIDLSPPGPVIYEDTLLSDLYSGTGISVIQGVDVEERYGITGEVELWVAGPNDAPAYQLGGDAKLSITIGTQAALEELVIARSTTLNRSMADLVADVNNALAATKFDSHHYLSEYLEAAYDGRRLVLLAKEPGVQFSVEDNGTFGYLGIQGDAIQADFVIKVKDQSYVISLAGLPDSPTVKDVMDLIEQQTEYQSGDDILRAVDVRFNATQTGLRLFATDLTVGKEEFRVDTLNGSTALLQLGFMRAGDEGYYVDQRPELNQAPNVIDGGSLGFTQVNQRFFVRNAELRIDGLTVVTPSYGDTNVEAANRGILGDALFGMVGVDTRLEGKIEANVRAALVDPNPYTTVEGETKELLLSELQAQTNVLQDPVVTTSQRVGVAPATIGAYENFIGWRLTGINGANAILVAIEPTAGTDLILHLADVQGTFSAGDPIGRVDRNNNAILLGAVTTGLSKELNYGTFELQVTVQPGFDDVAFSTGFELVKDKTYTLPMSLTDFGDRDSPPATSIDTTSLGDLLAFQNLSYVHVQDALHQLLRVLEDVEAGFDLLSTPLPAIGKSISDLLALVDGFERGVANADTVLETAKEAIKPDALDLPPLRLQDLPRALRSAFGMPVNAPLDEADADWVKFRFQDGMLLVDLSLVDTISTKLGLDIDTGDGLPNLTSGGVLQAAGLLDVRLNFGIDLTDPSKAYLYDSSRIRASLDVLGEGQEYANGDPGLGLVFRAALGPLAVFVKDGDATIGVEFELPMKDMAGGRKLLSDVEWTDWDTTNPIKRDHIDVTLPMFYGGEGPDDFIGEYKAVGTLAGGVPTTQPCFATIVGDIESGAVEFEPFDNITLAIDALDVYLQTLTERIASEVLSINLPFVGRQMADALFIEEFRNHLIRTLKDGIANAVNPTPELVTGLLEDALGAFLVGVVKYTPYDPGTKNEDRFREWTFTVGARSTDKTLTLDDFDLGIPNLEFDVDTPVEVTLDWKVNITFGVNYDEVAYIRFADGEEIDLKLEIALPWVPTGAQAEGSQSGVKGTLGYLPVTVSNMGSADTGLYVDFDVDVRNGNSGTDYLGSADLGAIETTATIMSGTDQNKVGGDIVTLQLMTAAMPGLPRITTNLEIDWAIPTPTDVQTLIDTLEGDAVAKFVTKIAYNDIWLDAGSVAGGVLEEVFGTIAEYIEPFMPVVDTISAPIPILSDVAGEDFTLIDLAKLLSGSDAVDDRFIEAVADILDVISAISSFANAPDLPLGSMVLYDGPGGDTDIFNPMDPDSHPSGAVIAAGTEGITLDGSFDGIINGDEDFLARLVEGAENPLAEGLTVPVLTDQLAGMRLLLGNESQRLIDYALPPLKVGFDFYQLFPIYGPLGVSIEIGFSFGIDLHSIGFDTYGYARYGDFGFRNEALILDGFYFSDTDASGVDAPEVTFEFSLVGAAELNLGIARAGVGGGIDAVITFDWHDPVADGNVHISEILGSIESSGNPIGMFDPGGALSFELFAFLEISLIGFRLDIPITPKTELFSFEVELPRDPLLATQNGDTLYLNMGPNAEDRLHGDTSDGNEYFSLKRDGATVYVWSDRLGVSEGEAQDFTGISHIVGLGGQGDDVVELHGFDGSGIDALLDGGIGDDRLEFVGSTASTDSVGSILIGGIGNDTLTGGDANDRLYGGEGNDTLKGGGGYDILFGDQGRVAESVDPKFISSFINESDGDDTLAGGDADDILFGAGGSDTLDGDAGNDLLVGDGGRFEYTMAGNHVDLSKLRPAEYERPDVNTDDPDDPETISAEIEKLYTFVMDRVTVTDIGLGGNDTIRGGLDDDLMLGGTGDDVMQGEGGDDFMIASQGFDEMYGDAGNDTMFGGEQADTMFGGTEDDVMAGGGGNDLMHGNTGKDVMKGDAGADVMFGDADDDQVFGLTDPDVLFGGANNDLVVGGTGDDVIFGDDGLVAKLDPTKTDGSGDTRIIGMGALGLLTGAYRDQDIRTVDLIITDVKASDGDDILSGEAGDDQMLGGGGNDRIGGDLDPRLPTAPLPPTPQTDPPTPGTPVGEDVMIGDGGQLVFDQRRFRLIEALIGQSAGTKFDDTMYGDNGNDYIFGGRGSDYIFGGHGRIVDVATGTVGAFRGSTDTFADDNDIIVGDNGQMHFAGSNGSNDCPPTDINFGQLTRVNTTDTAEDSGGQEYVEGEYGDDVIFGGVNGTVDPKVDRLYGDTVNPKPFDTANAGQDIVIGDNGEIDFDFNDTKHDLTTLDLIRSYRDGHGGTDQVSGNALDDVLIGGTAGDTMYGDDDTASAGAADGEDVMLGDNGAVFLIDTDGLLLVRVADMPVGTAVDRITTTDDLDSGDTNFDEPDEVEKVGGPDTMSGNAGNDIMLGGVNADDGTGDPEVDRLYGDRETPSETTIGNDGDDILLGDNGELRFTLPGGDDYANRTDADRRTLDLIRSYEDGLGGQDQLSGNKGLDVAIGSTGDDVLFGDDAGYTAQAADLADILLGDNADLFLVDADGAEDGDVKVVLGSAVDYLLTTDEENPAYGGVDRISGNAGGDIIAGGVFGDYLWGDRETPDEGSWVNDGNDIMLGDNARLEWLSNGRFADSAGLPEFIAENNPDLWAKYGTGVADDDLTTLDLITTAQPTKGGRDRMWGDEGSDLMFGGTDLDVMYGDDGNEDYETAMANQDVMFGDHGRLYPQFSTQADIHSRNFFAIDMGAADGGQGDVMRGEEGDDVMLGQQGDDRMWGGLDDDDMIGGHNRPGGYDELAAGAIDAMLKTPDNAMNDLMDGGFGDDAMAGDNAVIWRRGDDLSPRFRALTAETMYSTGKDSIIANVGDGSLATWQSDPADAVGRDIELLDHSDGVQATPLGRFGWDVMAGGADDDVMFGQLGDDLMQGDGAIELTQVAATYVSRRIDVSDSGTDPDTDTAAYTPLYFNVPENPDVGNDGGNDGDDYMEGNGGRDLMYGGLGQDDMIGGSSELFGLTTEEERPDDSDTMFGGAGIALGRNDIGATSFDLASEDATTHVITTTATGHARDADYMMGDNANVLRLVTGVTEVGAEGYDEFLTFNYDNYDAVLKLIPRAMQQLDYTLGGGDYSDGGYNTDGQATVDGQPADNGKADLIHGESGDDIIFGMTGSDVLFGEGQDDDIVGGYGHDWISGGTGQDGIIGDDGLVYTSRNSADYGESLYGIEALLAKDPEPKYSNGNVLNEAIATPGSIQTALINVKDQLKKSVDLVPFSYDSGWMGIDDEYPDNMGDSPFADDIIFGGLGSDWLHGGSGDDAISGAEALAHALVPQSFQIIDNELKPTTTLDLGYVMVGIESALIDNPTNMNPGNVLAFNREDTDGQHLNNRFRAGEFYLYDEYDPRREILLTATGELSKDATGSEYLLNFAEEEGVVRPAGTIPKSTGQSASSYPQVNDDGADAIFGDLGNDWLVGGTGRDNVYGGWGNDLMNVDDTHATNGGLNDMPDTHPYFEDRAYGGAGRDVLIGNTGGDRLIDWVGEYNSYLVPYAPFGQASVSRTLQPFLPEFLYALSKGDGADQSQASYDDDPRNGEPAAEMGLVLQKDQAWQDQTGAPADPQAGNIPGGKRDVLRSADFGDGTAQGFVAESGSWVVKSGRYEVSPLASSGTTDAISLFNADVVLPSYFEIAATLNAVKPTAGFKANAYVIFDYVSPTNFKFAGINVSTNKFEVGQRTAAGWQVLTSLNVLGRYDTDYNLLVAINGNTVTAVLNGKQSLSYAFTPRQDADGFTYLIRDGMIGLGGDNARARIDNVRVQVIPPAITYAVTDAFDGLTASLLAPDVGTWLMQGGRYFGTPAAGAPFALAGNDIRVGLNAMLRLETVVRTAATGGVVFDMYSPTDFKWAAVSVATQQVLIGHYTAKGGWVVDAAVSRSLAAGTDYALSVTLKGSTVSVLLNGQAALSRVYNSNVVDGAVGTFARGGSASFDSFGLATDDTRFAVAATSSSTLDSTTASTKTATTSTSKLVLGRQRSADSLEDGWRIDWSAAAKKAATPSKGHSADWQRSFALQLGKAERPNPNAGLRLWL